MKFSDVSISEGGASSRDAETGVYRVHIEPGGWTLVDVATPEVERRWSWEAIGAIESTPGGTTHDGRAAVTLDVVVNGWPVRMVFPAQQLPASAVAHIRSMAPAHVLVRCNPDSLSWALRRRLSATVHGVGDALAAGRHRRVALGAGAAVTVALVVAAFGVAFGAGGPTTRAQSGPVTRAASGVSSTTMGPDTTAAPTSAAPAGSSAPTTGVSTTKPRAKASTKGSSRPRHTRGAQPVTLAATSGPPSSESGPGTTTGSGTTTTKAPTGTTTTTKPTATTTTRPRPATTTTRPRPATTVPATTTEAPTTEPTTTATAPPPTTP